MELSVEKVADILERINQREINLEYLGLQGNRIRNI